MLKFVLQKIKIQEFSSNNWKAEDVKDFIYFNFDTTTEHSARAIFRAMKRKYGFFMLLLIYLFSFALLFFLSRNMFSFMNPPSKKQDPDTPFKISLFMSIVLFLLTYGILLKAYTKSLEKKHMFRMVYEVEKNLEEKYLKNDRERIWVASYYDETEKKDEIIGTIAIKQSNSKLYPKGIFQSDSQIAHLQRLAVDTFYQRRGVGKLLVEHATKWAKEKKYEYCSAGVFETNTAAVNFFKKTGFDVLVNKNVFEYIGLQNIVFLKKL